MANILKIYTDGAHSPLREQSGLGIVFLINDNKPFTYNKCLPGYTINQAELTAVIIALNAISKPFDKVEIYSDSQYVIGTITKNWQRKKNQKFWQKFDNILLKAKSFCNDIEFNWVKGHNDNEYNELADKLAVEASQFHESKKES